MKNVVTIGGGSGSYVILSALKQIRKLKLIAIITTVDDGGIARVERDQFGILPQSDLRKALIALSNDNENHILRKLFTYRFSSGVGFEGNTLGNLILAALTDINKDQRQAIKDIQHLLNINGEVEPITLDKTNILIKLENNQEIFGETSLDNPFWNGDIKIKQLNLVPKPTISLHAKKAIEKADYIIITPGDLYGSVIVNMAVNGFKKAVNHSSAKIIYICNLVTKYGQTSGYKVIDHLLDIEKYLNKKVDIVIVNKEKIPSYQLVRYAKEKSFPVTYNLEELNQHKVIAADLVDDTEYKTQKGDKLKRNVVRHDPKVLEEIFKKILV